MQVDDSKLSPGVCRGLPTLLQSVTKEMTNSLNARPLGYPWPETPP